MSNALREESRRRPTIEDFRGDFERIAAMMEESWAGGVQAPLLYTEEFLSSCFEYPGMSRSLAPTIYSGSEPVAFVAGFPRRVRFRGEPLDVAVVAFLTAAARHRHRGYGIVVWSELVKRLRAAGFDGMVNYCVEGEPMNQMISGACQRLGLSAARVFSIEYLSRLIRPVTRTPDDVDRGVVEAFLDAARLVEAEAELTRTWSVPEAVWQCTRAGAVVTRQRGRAGEGVVAGYVMSVANEQRTRCLLVDDVFWGELDGDGRGDLARRFLEDGAAAGARLAVAPRMGYADEQPLRDAGFRPSRRVVHLYLTTWSGSVPQEPVSSVYLDVF